jgi:hypothetical protein
MLALFDDEHRESSLQLGVPNDMRSTQLEGGIGTGMTLLALL